MARPSKLTYDRGTLILHPPPRGKSWIELATWDDRIEKFRVPAIYYRRLIETFEGSEVSFVDIVTHYRFSMNAIIFQRISLG